MSLLSVENLSLSIHGSPILKGINLSISQGEIVGVIGESGSGKSMTAYSILKLLPNGSSLTGRISLDGSVLTDASEAEMCALRGNDISMVFQEPMTALNPVKTIGDQVAETILIHTNTSRKEALKQARHALDRVELPEAKFPLSRYPHELSGGQRQRVVIAMAIALRPKLLIADEPTTALDVTTQAQILLLLKRLVQEDGMAMMFVTHDLAVVADLADRLVIMKSGEVVETGAAEALFSEMKHPYTRSLIAASGHVPDRSGTDVQDVPILEVKDLVREYPMPRTKVFGEKQAFRAVKGVSFRIRQGESLGLVGESGCGKSTLTRAILGLEAAQEGNVFIDGEPLMRNGKVDRHLRQKMQVVFQDPYGSFNPRHKVSRLVTEPFFLLDKQPSEAERAAAIVEALESVGLSAEDEHKYIHEFSGGQRQRIAIARALIVKPKLIILDEAVSALDVSIRAQILDLLADLSERFGLTYLFISHDLSVVRAVTDRVLVMKDGEFVERGETESVFNNPQHPYTQALIDVTPRLPEIDAA